MISDSTQDYAQNVASAFWGVDELYRAHPKGDSVGLIIMNLAVGHLEPERFDNIEDALTRFLELKYQSVSLPEVDRRLFYQQLCHTTLSILKWLRDGLPFPDRIRDFLHLTGQPPSVAALDRLRTDLRNLLSSMGFIGDLAEQCRAWENRCRVPVDEVKQITEELLDIAWDRTAQRIELPSPKEDGMKVHTMSSDHFNARCDYRARVIELNVDPIITLPALKHLVAHEAYPGHYVQFKLRESLYHAGEAAADGLFSMLKSPSSCIFEGVADFGIFMLDWVESDDDRVMALMNRYQAGVAAAAAWQLHALDRPTQQVRDWLRDNALLGGEGWVSHRMGYISPVQRGMHIWSYWRGEPIVESVMSRISSEQRPGFYRFLYGRLHSPQSISMYGK